jgi:hypothetical protein
VLWDKARVTKLSPLGWVVIAPIHFDEHLRLADASGASTIDEVTSLLIYQDSSQKRHCQVVSRIPDYAYVTSSVVGRPFTGSVMVEDWAGTFLKGYKYADGKIIPMAFEVVKRTNFEQNFPMDTAKNSGKMTTYTTPVTSCTTTDWYACFKNQQGELYDCEYQNSTQQCEIDWINNGDEPTNSTVYQYVVNGGSGGGSGSGSSSKVATLDTLYTNYITDLCLVGTLQYLTAKGGASSYIYDVMTSIFNYQGSGDIQLRNANISDTAEDAETQGYSNGEGGATPAAFTALVTVSNSMLATASSEYVAATLYHEFIHAYLDFLGINLNSADAQHESMANMWVGQMQSALMNQFPTLSSADAYALAWGGLYGTGAFQTLKTNNPSLAASIVNVNYIYKYGGKGTHCQLAN